ncbi:amino acid ABC transporter ATP-binding protein [Solibacillus silvestris]
MCTLIEVKNLAKAFGVSKVLQDISFFAKKNEVIAILGPSGSGKSTLLRSLVNLERIDFGDIIIDGQTLVKNGVYTTPQTRKQITAKMGMVFQNFNLFPHLTVRGNLEITPKQLKLYTKEAIQKQSEELLQKVGLLEKANEYPAKLSGGQKQRVAIARTLMLKPEILLFDEPTSALDPELTGEVLKVIKELAQENMTMLVVTHEMGFAREVADRIVFMDNGEIVETATPLEFFQNPQTRRAQIFLQNHFN